MVKEESGNMTNAARLGLRGAQAALLDHIERQGGMIHQSADDIGKAIGYSMAAASQALHRLRGQRLIWIDGYKQVRSPGKSVAVYRLNALPDLAPKDIARISSFRPGEGILLSRGQKPKGVRVEMSRSALAS